MTKFSPRYRRRLLRHKHIQSLAVSSPGITLPRTRNIQEDTFLQKYENKQKANLDIFRLRDESLEDTADLSDPDVLAAKIVEDLEAALEQFREIAGDLSN